MNERLPEPIPFPQGAASLPGGPTVASPTPAASQVEAKLKEAASGGDAESGAAEFRKVIQDFAQRLEPRQRARFYMMLDSSLTLLHNEAAVDSNTTGSNRGAHPGAALIGFHDFLLDRVADGERVIDLGCGDGALACLLADRRRARVTGVDWAQRSLDAARLRTGKPGTGPAPAPVFLGTDITIGRVEGSFDVVLLSNVLNQIAGRTRHLRTWLSWYTPKRFIIRVVAAERDWRSAWKRELGLDPRLNPSHVVEFTREQLEQELSFAGLAITAFRAGWGEYWAEAKPR